MAAIATVYRIDKPSDDDCISLEYKKGAIQVQLLGAEDGFFPVTEAVPFEELPDDWVCPLCKHPKSDFELQQ